MAVKTQVTDDDTAERRVHLLMTKGKEIGHDPGETPGNEEEEKAVLMEEASKYFQRNLFSFFVSMLAGLVSLMYIPSVMKVLHTSGRVKTRLGSFKRYLETLNHVVEWYKTPADRRISLKEVRRQHNAANMLSIKKTGVQMTQFDMVVTQWAFVGPMFCLPDSLGLETASDFTMEAFAHAWFQFGQALGVQREFNLGSGTLDEVKSYSRAIHRLVINPCLREPSPLGDKMANHLLEGCFLINPGIHTNAFKCFMYRLFEVKGWEEKAKKELVSWSDKLVYWISSSVVFGTLLQTPGVSSVARKAFNALMAFNIRCTNHVQKRIMTDYAAKITVRTVEFFRHLLLPCWYLLICVSNFIMGDVAGVRSKNM